MSALCDHFMVKLFYQHVHVYVNPPNIWYVPVLAGVGPFSIFVMYSILHLPDMICSIKWIDLLSSDNHIVLLVLWIINKILLFLLYLQQKSIPHENCSLQNLIVLILGKKLIKLQCIHRYTVVFCYQYSLTTPASNNNKQTG